MWILRIILALAALYIIFIAGPAVVSFLLIFRRRDTPDLEARDLIQPYFIPHLEEISAARAFLETLEHREVSVTAGDGTVLKGEYYDGGFDKTVIFLHGYLSTPLTHFSVQGHDLYRQGFNLLMIHQRGHGKSGGRRTSMGLLEHRDLLEWIRWVQSGTRVEKILLYGTSMGAATIACDAHDLPQPPVRAMVLDCGYPSVYDQLVCECAARSLPWRLLLPIVSLLARVVMKVDIRKDLCAGLEKCTVPALFFHGTADDTVPVEQGLRCYEHCASQKELFITQGAAHTIAYPAGGQRARDTLSVFVSRWL